MISPVSPKTILTQNDTTIYTDHIKIVIQAVFDLLIGQLNYRRVNHSRQQCSASPKVIKR